MVRRKECEELEQKHSKTDRKTDKKREVFILFLSSFTQKKEKKRGKKRFINRQQLKFKGKQIHTLTHTTRNSSNY